MVGESDKKRKHGLFMESSSPCLSIFGQVDFELDETIQMLTKRRVQVTVHNLEPSEVRERATYLEKGKENNAPTKLSVKENVAVLDKGKAIAISSEGSHGDENIVSKRVLAQRLRRERERSQGIIRQPKYFPSLVPTRMVLAQKRRCEMERETTQAQLLLETPSQMDFRRTHKTPLTKITTQTQLPRPQYQDIESMLPPRNLGADFGATVTDSLMPTVDQHHNEDNDNFTHSTFLPDTSYVPRNMPTIAELNLNEHADEGRHFLGTMDVVCPFCSALHWIDEKLAKSSLRNPVFGTCCLQGKIKLPILRTPPQTIKELYDENGEKSISFRNHIRRYNASNAFTSLGSTMEPRILNGRGPTSFTIHGELRHRTGSLIPEPGRDASYSQLYIYDPESALNIRDCRNPLLRRDVLKIIQDALVTHNDFSKKYRQAYEILMESNSSDLNLPAYLHFSAVKDRRRYNLPSSDEIAVILPGDGTELSGMRDIIVHLKGNNALKQINECHPAYLPLHYVLLFPHGELGWEPGLTQWDVMNNKALVNRITQMQWYCYRLFERSTEYSTILKAGNLFQEFLVDAWAATEQNRLTYIRLNQGKLRAELYKGLTDIEESGLQPNQVGQRFILPSSFMGSPRHMFEIYQDSLAITRYNKHPDLFITMTANPKWPEIKNALLPHQRAIDRPDLVARVFELKRKCLMNEILKKGVLGQTVAHVFTIEFQKRGLPHMHALIFLRHPDKIRTTDQVDRLVYAEFPDPIEDPVLFKTVMSCMVHGPCGARDPNAVCMENGKCTKKYPRKFSETTTIDQDGYPIYRRRETGKVYYTAKGHPVDNRDVVPYNPYLSKLFDCHINVEVCAGLRCVKYIHKYIYKGYDRATFVLGGLDEIQQYLDARYIGSPEAAWRIFGHLLHEEIPTVVRLAIHLPGMHRVVFNPDESMEVILSRAGQQTSTLIAFFDCCELNQAARGYTYQEFPQHFVWNKQHSEWTTRKQGFAIGRMYFASPNSGERFYLRLLLTVVRGPQSFEAMRMVNSVPHETFKAACIARGLLEDDGEWIQCLVEAAIMNTGYQMRRLFSVILIHCSPLQPLALWNQFSINICDDLAYKLRAMFGIPNPSETQIIDYGLYLLNQLLQESGKNLLDFPPMLLPSENWSNLTGNRLIWEHRLLQYEGQEADVKIDIDRLNGEQSFAYTTVLSSVVESKGTIFFLSGGAGTGKTFLYNTLAAKCRSLGHIVITVASSGIASLLLVGGRTAHSTFSIPLDVLENSGCGFSKQSMQAELFRETKLIVWDEVPMQHRYCIEAVDRTLQDIRDDKRPFGGITVVLGGDFRQILPVVPRGVRQQIVAASLKRSPLWNYIKVLTLSLNMRLNDTESGNAEFAKFLIEIGTNSRETVELPMTMHKCRDLPELLSSIYPQLNVPGTTSPEFFTERTILSSRNDDVNAINLEALNIFPGEIKIYFAADKMVEDCENENPNVSHYPNEYLNSLDPPGLPPFKLELKVGCPIMLLRNLAPKDGHCNGTRLIVVRCAQRIIEAQILTGDKSGNLVFIPRISLSPSSSELPIQMTRRQFPIRLAYAMTINKSQGQSVKFVGVDLRTPVFSHG